MNTNKQLHFRKNQKSQGFTLIEVLITLVITAAALLGISLIQASAIMNVSDAAQRSQATALTYEMLDRIRANQGALDSYAPKSVGYGKTAITDVAGTPSTMAQRAQRDLYQWQQKLSSVGGRQSLFRAIGTIVKSSNVITVSLSWQARAQPGEFKTRNIMSTTEF